MIEIEGIELALNCAGDDCEIKYGSNTVAWMVRIGEDNGTSFHLCEKCWAEGNALFLKAKTKPPPMPLIQLDEKEKAQCKQ